MNQEYAINKSNTWEWKNPSEAALQTPPPDFKSY